MRPILLGIEDIQSGRRLAVNDTLLPPGWHIHQVGRVDPGDGSTAHADLANRNVLIPRYAQTGDAIVPFLQASFSSLPLLHEIGHAHHPPPIPTLEEKAAISLIRQILRNSRMEGQKALPRSLESTYVKFIETEERFAHSFALRTLRKLRTEGFDLEPGTSNREIVCSAEKALGSYDVDFLDLPETTSQPFPVHYSPSRS